MHPKAEQILHRMTDASTMMWVFCEYGNDYGNRKYAHHMRRVELFMYALQNP